MKRIDTRDWSEVVIAVGSRHIIHRTLQSEEWYRNFCDDYGYGLISFRMGTNPHCAKNAEDIVELSTKEVGGA